MRVTDAVAATADKEEAIWIFNSVQLQITNITLPTGTVSGTYSTQLGATGGKLPYSFELASGSANLPPGLLLNSTGRIAGWPITNGTLNFIVEVRDAAAGRTNKFLGITINPQPILGSLSHPGPDQVQFQISGAAGESYAIEVSTNLSGGNWLSLCVTNLPADAFTFFDATATNHQRFYRVGVAN